MGETWKDLGVGLTKVRNIKRWLMKQGRRAEKFILPHWLTSVIWRMPNWRQSNKNLKVELYSEATLWKMILDLMQYSQNKDLQHLKWRQQKSWTSCPDCQNAQDKQLMQYLLIPKSEWKMLQNYWKFPIRNVQTFGFVYHDTSGQNHGPVWKIQSFLSNEICMVILWQDCYGKGNLKKSGRGFQLGMLLRTPWKRIILFCVCGWQKIGWKETKHWSDVESTQQRSRFGRTNIFP